MTPELPQPFEPKPFEPRPSDPLKSDPLPARSHPAEPQPTESQSYGNQAVARRLSMQATMPPADVPGVRMERFLGSGAFGQVWVGRDLNTGRGVAVKFYLHRGGVNWSLLSREVKNLVQLSADRHVVQVLEVGWDADPPYYVMELVEGGSLEDMLLRRGRLPVGEAVEMFRKICVGLNHCHGKGVLHCDVKPANILLATDDEPRLADFGQSRMSHDQTPAMGTLFYMAPEQADLQSTPDARWDVYAAGAILYRMLGGNPPHRDQSLLSQLDTAGSLPGRLACYREAIAAAPPAMNALRRVGVDRALRRIMAKCLAVDPQERYANMQQVLDDLRRRDTARARRPLLVLGILGPLLLLAATCFFGARSIDRVSGRASAAVRDEAFSSNDLAARYAAQTLETELRGYFELARNEASRKAFKQNLSAALADPVVGGALRTIASAGTPAEADKQTVAREKLLDAPVQLKLDAYLSDRLALYSGDNAVSNRQIATMFVTDASGTIVTICYDSAVPRNRSSTGRSFAYRTYFNGEDDDLPYTVPLNQTQPLTSTHLSAAFQSTATGLWKVAVSTPIYLTDPPETTDDGPPRQPDGVFVATINLGDFQLLSEDHRETPDTPGDAGGRRRGSQIVVLVEGREGPLRGTVLQHPLMSAPTSPDKELSQKRFQVDVQSLDRLLEGRDDDYLDPMAAAVGGEPFGGPWIAAMQPVSLPETGVGDPSRGPTDLLVLVQYRLSEALGPVEELRRSLLREGAASIVSILLVTLFMWWVVRRVTDDRPESDPGGHLPPVDDTGEPAETEYAT